MSNQITIERVQLVQLMELTARLNSEVAFSANGGFGPGSEDWAFLAGIQRHLGIENEDLQGSWSALRFRDMIAEQLESVNQIIATGSVDGILTTAALLRVIGEGAQVDVVFTQAFEVDKLDISSWQPGRKVAFVDLAVNNRNPQMTAEFVTRVRAAGHEIVAVIDEHSREDWLVALGTFKGLIIEPMSQSEGEVGSAGEVLRKALTSVGSATHMDHLLSMAAAADQMNFLGVGEIANKAIKPAIQDNARRVYLARHFAFNREADETIQNWVAEYDATFGAAHEAILAEKQDLGDGIVRVVTTGRTVDMTVLMKSLYDAGARVVVLEGEQWAGPAKGKILQVSFGTGEKDLDLMAAIREAGIEPSGGFANKVNLNPEDEPAATEAVRALLRS